MILILIRLNKMAIEFLKKRQIYLWKVGKHPRPWQFLCLRTDPRWPPRCIAEIRRRRGRRGREWGMHLQTFDTNVNRPVTALKTKMHESIMSASIWTFGMECVDWFWNTIINSIIMLKLHTAYVLRWNHRKNVYFFSHS